MAYTTYNSTEDMIIKLQSLKGKTKLKNYKNISNYYGNFNIRMDEDTFAENAQGVGKIYHELLMLMNFLQPKLQVKNMNNNYYVLYYTVSKNRDEKEIVSDKDNENDYITPNHYIGSKNISAKLR